MGNNHCVTATMGRSYCAERRVANKENYYFTTLLNSKELDINIMRCSRRKFHNGKVSSKYRQKEICF